MKDFGQDAGMATFTQFPASTSTFDQSLPMLAAAGRNGGGTTAAGGGDHISLPAASSPNQVYLGFGKRLLDILLVIASAPVTLPIILLCVLALKLEGGSAFYRQDRLGRGGKLFSILKLRTMVPNADKRLEEYLANDPALRHEWDTTQKLKNDPRVTALGKALRATSLDELPQLWNVLIGDMSLVGPRPMMPEQLSMYGNPEPYFALRPGITGVWQVSARNESHFAYRSKIDAIYYSGVSAWGDVVLMARTVGVVLRRTGY